MLSHFVNENQSNWDEFLQIVLFAYRTSVQQTTTISPFEMLYNRDPTLPSDVDMLKPNIENQFVKNINEVWREARKNINKSAKYEIKRLNNKYKSIKYRVGQLIRVHSPATKVGLKTKLRSNLWQGPYPIVTVYNNGNVDIKIGDKIRKVHVNRIKPAEELRNETFRT
jgi:hypothetical protein